MIQYSSSPSLVRQTFWELLNAGGKRGLYSLAFSSLGAVFSGLYASALFTGFEQLSGFHKGMSVGATLLCLLFIGSFISMYRVYSWRAKGLSSENPETHIEIELFDDKVQIRLDGELTELPWSAVALVKESRSMLVLMFEGLCCLGIPRDQVAGKDADLLMRKLEADADNHTYDQTA